MADTKYTYQGRKIAISGTVQNTDMSESDASAMTFTEIAGAGNIGSYGSDTNMLSYNALNDDVTSKQKGNTDAGSPTVECARKDSDPGQTAMRAAGKSTVKDAYVFRVTNQDGSIDYLRGPVSGPVNQGGSGEDFDLDVYTIGLTQEPIHVSA